jgi:hypothetical protein
MAAEMLRAAVEPEILSLDDPRQAAKAIELLPEAVGTRQRTDENPFPVRIMLLLAHDSLAKGAFTAPD